MKKKTRGKKAPTMLFSSDLLLVVRVVIVSYPSSQHDNGAFWCLLLIELLQSLTGGTPASRTEEQHWLDCKLTLSPATRRLLL